MAISRGIVGIQCSNSIASLSSAESIPRVQIQMAISCIFLVAYNELEELYHGSIVPYKPQNQLGDWIMNEQLNAIVQSTG